MGIPSFLSFCRFLLQLLFFKSTFLREIWGFATFLYVWAHSKTLAFTGLTDLEGKESTLIKRNTLVPFHLHRTKIVLIVG